ncbi:ATP-dependent sacrificial sulfur transferase LarE [Acetobacterium tundrae]|uniref:ATP-dependent sacrificial sulfur transferase LarE n=1 Tax=Acetobacterium tundrae TaxID=132932 RepID=A0ABR6WGP2_9FIRM|nr:ATP-dependent sacrificial sulfur transferase LarE [Acetobacterium tundrae]MBC3795650.1 ATP-dependent sacrificial sulfur transferase LarE [Acetobacterium tundrae]
MANQTTLSPVLKAKLTHLKECLNDFSNVCIAFSGGVDSTLLLKTAVEVLGKKVLPITVNGAMLPRSEFAEAQALANEIGVSPLVIEADVFALENFVKNSSDRCYHCKKFIFTQIKKAAIENGYNVILDGSNLDDMKDYRPGIRALGELGIYSPLKESGLKKQDIRDLSAYYGLPTAAKPAMACLATRIPTSTRITPEALKAVEAGEDYLKSIGLSQYRLRLLGDTAKIECAPEDFNAIIENRQTLVATLKNLGIKTVTLDLAGYGCGNMNG